MAIGVIGSAGKQNAYKDYNVTIPAQTGGEKEGRVVVNMPTSILYIKML